jgi:hypothetical protein
MSVVWAWSREIAASTMVALLIRLMRRRAPFLAVGRLVANSSSASMCHRCYEPLLRSFLAERFCVFIGPDTQPHASSSRRSTS